MATSVTRLEVASYVASAFSDTGATPDSLIGEAETKGARLAVLDQLHRLERPLYADIRDLWGELGDLPIEPEPSQKNK
jgi:hypothetical protein